MAEPLKQHDFEEAQWNLMEKSCMNTSKTKLMLGHLPKGWNDTKAKVAQLRAFADKWSRKYPPKAEVSGYTANNDVVLFRQEGGNLIRLVNGKPFVGKGDSSGIVRYLRFSNKRGKRKQGTAHVEDQGGAGCFITPQALHILGAFATVCGIRHNIPDEIASMDVIHSPEVGNYAIIGFKQSSSATMAYEGLQKEEYKGHKLLVAWAREPWPLYQTTHRDLSIYGVGVQLYFYWMRILAYVTLFGACLGFPLVYGCIKGNALNALQDIATASALASFLANTTIANLGVLRNDTSTIPATFFREVTFSGETRDIRDITLWAAILDALIALAIFAMGFWLENHHIPKVTKMHAAQTVNVEAWAVQLEHLPKWTDKKNEMVNREVYRNTLKFHFEAILRAHLIASRIHPGLQVVKKDDRGRQLRIGLCAKLGWLCCKRTRGCDLMGRRVGQLIQIDTPSRTCRVQWLPDGGKPEVQENCSLDDLHDAELLARLEEAGCGEQSYYKNEPLIYEVSLVVDYEGQLRNLKQRYEKMVKDMSKGANRVTKSMNAAWQRKAPRKSTGVSPAEKQRMRKDLETYAGVRLDPKRMPVEGAYVIFSRARHRDFIVNEYRFSRTIFRTCGLKRRLHFVKSPIRVSPAPSPGNIFWDNIDVPNAEQRKRLAFVVACCLVLFFIVLGCSTAAKHTGANANENTVQCDTQAQIDANVECQCRQHGYYNVLNDVPAGIYDICKDWLHEKAVAAATSTFSVICIICVNAVANSVAFYLAKATHPVSMTSLNNVAFNIAFILQTLNLGVITVLVYMKFDGISQIDFVGKGAYRDLVPEWYLVVGSSILTAIWVNAFFPMVGTFQVPLFFLRKRWCGHRKETREELLKLYTPPPFEFAMRHAQQMCGLFVMISFSSGMPILYLMIPWYLFVFYWSDKFTLLRGSHAPPAYGNRMMTNMAKWLQLAILTHALVAIFVYGEPTSAPSYCSGCSDEASLGKFTVGDHHNNVISFAGDTNNALTEKLIYTSTFPGLLLLIFVSFVYMLELVLWVFGESIFSFLKMLRGGDKMKQGITKATKRYAKSKDILEMLQGPYTRAIRELQRLSKATTFDISKAAGYEFLDSMSSEADKLDVAPHQKKPAIAASAAPKKQKQAKPVPEGKQAISEKTPLTDARCDMGDQSASGKKVWHAKETGETGEEDYIIHMARHAEETFDNIQMQASLAGEVVEEGHAREKGRYHRKSMATSLVDDQAVTGIVIDLGTVLECKRHGLIYEEGMVHLNAVIGEVEVGDILEAAGPPEVEYGYLMIPIQPWGVAELDIFMDEEGINAIVDEPDERADFTVAENSAAPVDTVAPDGDESSEQDQESVDDASARSQRAAAHSIGIGTKLICLEKADIYESLSSDVVVGLMEKDNQVEAAGTPVEVEGCMMVPIWPKGVVQRSCVELASVVNGDDVEVSTHKQSTQPGKDLATSTTAEGTRTQRSVKSPVGSEEARPCCEYGAECFRNGEEHRKEYSHPGDLDWNEEGGGSSRGDAKPEFKKTKTANTSASKKNVTKKKTDKSNKN